MIGRGLRPADDKRICIVIDHAGCTAMHGFVEEEVDWSLDVTSSRGKPIDLEGPRQWPRARTRDLSRMQRQPLARSAMRRLRMATTPEGGSGRRG